MKDSTSKIDGYLGGCLNDSIDWWAGCQKRSCQSSGDFSAATRVGCRVHDGNFMHDRFMFSRYLSNVGI